MLVLVEFFDAAFLRLLWALVVDYLVTSGYLLPEQRQLWVEGYVHIVSAIGAILFIGIWMHHSNKKESLATLQQNVTTTTRSPFFGTLLASLKNFVIKEKTTTTTTATPTNNPDGITHLPTPEPQI
jgi:drug/metabolite transporter (DMT)-like permease